MYLSASHMQILTLKSIETNVIVNLTADKNQVQGVVELTKATEPL